MMCAPPTKTYLFDVIGDLLQDTQEALLKLASARNRKPAQGRAMLADVFWRVTEAIRTDSDPVLRYLRLWTRRSTLGSPRRAFWACSPTAQNLRNLAKLIPAPEPILAT
jgi:hypothetical protein